MDVEEDNVLLGEDGTLYFIDPIIKFKKSASEVIVYLEFQKEVKERTDKQSADIDKLAGEPRTRFPYLSHIFGKGSKTMEI